MARLRLRSGAERAGNASRGPEPAACAGSVFFPATSHGGAVLGSIASTARPAAACAAAAEEARFDLARTLAAVRRLDVPCLPVPSVPGFGRQGSACGALWANRMFARYPCFQPQSMGCSAR